MAANLTGCTCASVRAEVSPVRATASDETSPKMPAMRILFLASSSSLFLIRNHALIPTTNTDASTKPEVTVCRNLSTATGFSTTSAKLFISFLAVSGLNTIPTGFSIQALATSIQRAERLAPMATSQVEVRWNFLLTLFQPKNITATKVDSRKKAMIPSTARGAPNMSPTNHE